jgi:hypothetical protein
MEPNKLDLILTIWRDGHDGGTWDRLFARVGDDPSEAAMLRALFRAIGQLDEALKTFTLPDQLQDQTHLPDEFTDHP